MKKSNFFEYFGFDISTYVTEVSFAPDEMILQEGEVPRKLYYMYEGRAKLFITHKNGSTNLINFLEGPCFIGEMELFDPERPAHGVSAIHPCKCFCVDVDACRENLSCDVKFLQNLCRILSEKALSDVSNYSKNQTYPLKMRLASFILKTERSGIYRERHTETAGYLGVTYRHLLYVLAEFVKEGILEKSPSGYRIVNRERLKECAAE